MHDDENVDFLKASEALEMGTKRMESMSVFDSPVYLPPDPPWTLSVRDLAKDQITKSKNIESLVCSYIELLARAKALTDFWTANVGRTEDWPVMVMGESDEVDACLDRRVKKLQMMVALLDESVCS